MNYKHYLQIAGRYLGIALGIAGNILSDFFYSLVDEFTKPNGFSAAFGKETDIGSRFNKGFLFSKYRRLTRKRSYENLIISSPTGGGKTSKIIIPLLLELRNFSAVLNDPAKECHEKISGYLAQHCRIIALNFGESTASAGYNILSRIKNGNDVNKCADLLIRATEGNSGDPFWGLQGRNLLATLIRIVLYQSEKYRNMANVLYLLNLFAAAPKRVNELVVKTRDKKLLLDYKAIIAMPSKTLMNVVATVKASLQIFESPEIAKVTSVDTIDFEDFRRTPTILLLHTDVGSQKFVSTLQAIFFEQWYNYLLSRIPEKDELDIFNIIEEASSLYIPGLPIYLANTRKHRVGNLICVQSPSQLNTYYKEDAKNILSNCVTKLYLPGITELSDMRSIEELSGKTIYTDKKGTERVRPLITVDEIRQLPADRSLILSGNNPLIKGRTRPYYKSGKYRQLTEIPPVPLKGSIPEGPIPLIGEEEEQEENSEEEGNKEDDENPQ